MRIALILSLFLIICLPAFCGQMYSLGTSVTLYDSTIITPLIKIWSDTCVTDANGMCTFALTTNGSLTGTPIFNTIISYTTSGHREVSSAVNAPLAFVNKLSGLSYIGVRTVRGTTLAALGDTLIWGGTNCIITLIVIGY